MTNTPGEGPTPEEPQDDARQTPPQQGQDQPGYWEQQQQPGYGYPPPPGSGYGQEPRAMYPPDHPQATTALVVGIVGIVVCAGLISPIAWVIGKKAVDEIDASRGMIGGRGAAQAGYILGIVGTCILAVYALALLLVLAFGVLGAVVGA